MSGAKYEAKFTWPSAAPHSVIVTGTFDSWSGNTHPLTKVGEGFEGSIELEWGQTYEYKYVVDGTWQAREDQDKEWDSAGNMNNVVRAPPAPAHVAEPTPKPTDKPAVDLPAATVIAPAAAAGAGVAGVAAAVVGSKAEDKETVVPQGSGARPEDISARKQEVSKAIDEATTGADSLAKSSTPSVNDTVAPHTIDSDLSSTRSVRAADGLAMAPASSVAAAEQPPVGAAAPKTDGGLTVAQQIASSSSTDAARAAAAPAAAPTTTAAKPIKNALEPLTDVDAVPAENVQAQLTERAAHLQEEAEKLAHQGLEQAQHFAEQAQEQAQRLAQQASAGVAGLVAGVEGLVFGHGSAANAHHDGTAAGFAAGQTKALEHVDGGNLHPNLSTASSSAAVPVVDAVRSAPSAHTAPAGSSLPIAHPVTLKEGAPTEDALPIAHPVTLKDAANPTAATPVALAAAAAEPHSTAVAPKPTLIEPPIDFASLPATTATGGSLASTLSTSGRQAPAPVQVTDAKKVERDGAPALEAARQDLAAKKAGPTAAAATPASTTPAAAPASTTPAAGVAAAAAAPAASAAAPATPAAAAPAVPAKDASTVPGGYPSSLSTPAGSPAKPAPAKKTAADEAKISKRKSSIFGSVKRIFSGKDKQ